MNIQQKKQVFIHREVCSLCFIASFGMARRFPFYKETAERKTIQEYIRERLWKLIPLYSQKIYGGDHIDVVEAFQGDVNQKFSTMLARGGIAFGRTQKLINLYLKYMWAAGFIEEPPHCPVDSIIIGKLGPEIKGLSFTNMSKDDYKKVLTEIDKVRGNQSIAEWELYTFERR